MKTAVSIPDKIFREAEQAAKRLKLSRSELYRRAIEAFIVSQREREIAASYDVAYSDTESPAESRFRHRVARKTLLDVEWT